MKYLLVKILTPDGDHSYDLPEQEGRTDAARLRSASLRAESGDDPSGEYALVRYDPQHAEVLHVVGRIAVSLTSSVTITDA